MSKLAEYALGIEEVAAAIAVAGIPEAAKGLLVSNFGRLSADEERGRLLSANHSLYARGLLTVSDHHPQLIPDLTRIVTVFTSNTRSLRMGKTSVFGEDVLAYYHDQDGWVKHAIRDGVAHYFTLNKAPGEMEAEIFEFFSPSFKAWSSIQPIELPDTLFADLDPRQRRSQNDVLAFIHKTSPAHPSAELLSADLAQARLRGSMLWLEQISEDDLATRGTLLIQGLDRLWMLNSKAEGEISRLVAQLATYEQFKLNIHDFVPAST